MSITIVPPFTVTARISDRVTLDPDEVSLKRLRNVVAGKDRSFPRSKAIALLQASDFPNKHRDLESLLENEKETPEIRYIAALGLGKINTTAALEILLNNSHIRDERVLAGIMKALGRIGNNAALEVVEKARKFATGFAASQADFAATLISHRMGLKRSKRPAPNDDDYLELADGFARPFQITRAGEADAEFSLRSLGSQPFGIELAEDPIYQVRCGRRVWMILFNRNMNGKDAFQALRERNAFPGMLAIRNETTGQYSVALLMLTSPAKRQGTVDIQVYRPTGDRVFGGIGVEKENRMDFSIRSVSRPGAFAIQVEGAFKDGRLEIKSALSTTHVQVEKRQPIKGRPESLEV